MSIILGIILGAIPVGLYLCGVVSDPIYFFAGMFLVVGGIILSFLPASGKAKKEEK